MLENILNQKYSFKNYVIIIYVPLDSTLNQPDFRLIISTSRNNGRSNEVKSLCFFSYHPRIFLNFFFLYYSTLYLGFLFLSRDYKLGFHLAVSDLTSTLLGCSTREERGFRNKCRLNRLYQPWKFSVSRSNYSRFFWFVCFLLISLAADTSRCDI